MKILLFLLIIAMYCDNNSYFIYDLNVEFYGNEYLTIKKTDFRSKQIVYALMTLYNRKLNTTRSFCLEDMDCLKHLKYNNNINIPPGSCPLSDNKNLYLFIENVYLKTEDKINKYTLYNENPRYYGTGRDSTITHYKYNNGSYCMTQVVFSFILKKYHSEFGNGTLPNLFIHYTYIFSNTTVNIENYKHTGTHHKREKISNNLYTCCSTEICGYIHPNSCFKYEIDIAIIPILAIIICVAICFLNCCPKLNFKKKERKDDYKEIPVKLIDFDNKLEVV